MVQKPHCIEHTSNKGGTLLDFELKIEMLFKISSREVTPGNKKKMADPAKSAKGK